MQQSVRLLGRESPATARRHGQGVLSTGLAVPCLPPEGSAGERTQNETSLSAEKESLPHHGERQGDDKRNFKLQNFEAMAPPRELNQQELGALLDASLEGVKCAPRKTSYAPYSKFHVGAALLGVSGKTYSGRFESSFCEPCVRWDPRARRLKNRFASAPFLGYVCRAPGCNVENASYGAEFSVIGLMRRPAVCLREADKTHYTRRDNLRRAHGFRKGCGREDLHLLLSFRCLSFRTPTQTQFLTLSQVRGRAVIPRHCFPRAASAASEYFPFRVRHPARWLLSLAQVLRGSFATAACELYDRNS
ncbi:MAG: hypothetical protein BJ554DRAFT_5245, partial [Olpidium bornovanus]